MASSVHPARSHCRRCLWPRSSPYPAIVSASWASPGATPGVKDSRLSQCAQFPPPGGSPSTLRGGQWGEKQPRWEHVPGRLGAHVRLGTTCPCSRPQPGAPERTIVTEQTAVSSFSGMPNAPCDGLIGNTSCSAGRPVPTATTRLCRHRVTVVRGDLRMNKHGPVPIKLYLRTRKREY